MADQHQQAYWDTVADSKNFTHELNADWLNLWVPRDSLILDYGCGYGRSVQSLQQQGYTNVSGIDTSPAMIARGLREHPELRLQHVDSLPAPYDDDSFDAVLLFAVLTCIQSDEQQQALLNEVRRILKPGGFVHISDFPIQTDSRNQERYAFFQEKFGVFGVFEVPDGGILRHHTQGHFSELFNDFSVLAEETRSARTMNGNPSTCIQFMLKKPW